jgi:diguanylate cyclase (GGDEF)-like protein
MRWQRIKEQHFADYTVPAFAYWMVMAALAAAALGAAAAWLAAQTPRQIILVAAMACAAGVAAWFPLQPAKGSRFYFGGEVFVFVALLLFGPAAAVLVVAAETGAGTTKVGIRPASRIASVATVVVVMALVGYAFAGALPVPLREEPFWRTIAATAVAALAHVTLSALLAEVFTVLRRRRPLRVAAVVRAHARPAIGVAAGAGLGALMAGGLASYGVVAFVAACAVVASSMAALHYWQQYRRSNEAHVEAMSDAQRKLHEAAYADSLTGLPNRRRFTSIVEEIVGKPDASYAVMFIDADNFKQINDTHGHHAGDAFLCEVSRRLLGHARDTDVVARLGGDEFAVLLSGRGARSALLVAERMLASMREPVLLATGPVSGTLSIGIATSALPYTNVGDLLRDADIAMYAAKDGGKNRAVVFDLELSEQHRDRVALEADATHALDEGGFTLAYQPLFRIADRRLVGFEALARWNHPSRGAVSPAVFVPMLTRMGLITRLTRRLLPRALSDLAAFQAMNPHLRMHVNVAAADLAEAGFADVVREAISAAAVRADSVEIELTEGELVDARSPTLTAIAQLRRTGVGVAIDDFGTGYSSLARLADLPVTSYKVDAAFVRGLRPASKQLEVVKVIVALGRTLNKGVIAEGIETMEQMNLLLSAGCEFGQGFAYASALTRDVAMGRVRDDLLRGVASGAAIGIGPKEYLSTFGRSDMP